MIKQLTIEELYQLTREIMSNAARLDELYPNSHSVNLHLSIMMKINYAYELGYKTNETIQNRKNKGASK